MDILLDHAIVKQRLVEALSFRGAEHALRMFLFIGRIGQRQDAVVVEVN
jgi:hypothetical protein